MCAPQPATQGPGSLGAWEPGFLDTQVPRHCTPAPLSGVKLHVVHCPSSNQKLVTSSCHHDAPQTEPSVILTRQHHSRPPSQSPWRAPATRYRLSSFRGPSKAASSSQVGSALLLHQKLNSFSPSPPAPPRPATLPPSPSRPSTTSLLTPPFTDIPKLDLESYIQNYRGTWSSPAAMWLHPH